LGCFAGTLYQLEQDIAFYFLARGDYAYIGYNTWGMGWPLNSEPAHGTVPEKTKAVPIPGIFTDPTSLWNSLGTPALDPVRKRLHCAILYSKPDDHFTKTGSGQTQEKLEHADVFCRRPVR